MTWRVLSQVACGIVKNSANGHIPAFETSTSILPKAATPTSTIWNNKMSGAPCNRRNREYFGRSYGVSYIACHDHCPDMLLLEFLLKRLDLLLCFFISKIMQY